MDCPVCGKPMYDNRENKKNPKAPDYRCKDKNCKWELDKETKQWVPSEYGTALWVKKASQTPNLSPNASGSIFQGTKPSTTDNPKIIETSPIQTPKQPIIKDIITNNSMSKEEWAKKEYREHKRALTMQAFNLFAPMTNETANSAMDRWLEVKTMRDIMLVDLYND